MKGPVVRARDVRPKLKEMGFEKGVAHLIELMCEELSAQRQMIEELGKNSDTMAGLLNRFTDIVGANQSALQKIMSKEASEGMDAPHATDQH